MCGISGFINFDRGISEQDRETINAMNARLKHRGPDAQDSYCFDNVALGFSRLSIIGLDNGMQPIWNETEDIVLVCNGEVFNYIELKKDLIEKGHRFRTQSDIEVILHLYEEYETEFLNKLNGQFAFALYDCKKKRMMCARDHMGIVPFHYTRVGDNFVFASEIKAILEHPAVTATLDMVGLDQVFTFAGLISPRTMFKNIKSLENGHYILVDQHGKIKDVEYWDLVYPEQEVQLNGKKEDDYIEEIEELLNKSIKLRLRSDVPSGMYLSGGLDSSMITMKVKDFSNGTRKEVFSIDFAESELSETKYQKLVAKRSNSRLNKMTFFYSDISKQLPRAIYHCECPIKETYNTASLSLSKASRERGIKVILSGEGSDELFAGYVGYRFDNLRAMNLVKNDATPGERKIREQLWGDPDFFYESNFEELALLKKQLYSKDVGASFEEINCLNHKVVNRDRMLNRDVLSKRSYLDFKLRLVDHLVSDHGDRMALANSVEVRYPFLDKDFVEFSTKVPPSIKLKDMEEKYVLKKMARRFVPNEVVDREKFGFIAPGSPYLLQNKVEHIQDLLSYDTIKKQGIFDPDYVEALKKRYSQPGFTLNIPFESDLLITVSTLGMLMEEYF